MPKPHHLYRESNDNHRAEDKTQGHRGHHFPSLGHEGNDETNEQERDQVADVNASGCEKHISAEMMIGNLISLNRCKYRWLDQSTDNSPQEESSDNGGGCQPRGGAEALSRKLEDGF